MKRAVLSIGLLLSATNIYCSDKETPINELDVQKALTNLDSSGNMLIHIAINKYPYVSQYTKPDTCAQLVTLMQQLHNLKFDLNKTNGRGQTALHLAVEHNITSVIEALLKLNANPNIKDAENNTPLTIACKKPGNTPIINMLLKHGANTKTVLSGYEMSLTKSIDICLGNTITILEHAEKQIKASSEPTVNLKTT